MKRATIVGEQTRGGAHPTRGMRIDDQFSIGVPFARSINPITKTNWEGTGITPDVKIPAGQALETAKKLIGRRARRVTVGLGRGPQGPEPLDERRTTCKIAPFAAAATNPACQRQRLSDRFKTNARAAGKAPSSFAHARQKLGMMHQTILEPIIIGVETNQNRRGARRGE